MWPFEWNYIPFLIYGSVVCFLLPKCVFFTNGVYRNFFTMFFITTICVYDFCETVLVKNTHTLPRYDLNFPFQNAVCLHWLFDGTAQTHLWALKHQKRNAPVRAYAPRTLRTRVLKKNLPASSFFACTYISRSVLYWHCLLTVSYVYI